MNTLPGEGLGRIESHLAGDGTRLHYRGREIFLSGANLAWFNYGKDFGAHSGDTHVRLSYAASRTELQEGLERLGTFVQSLR